MMGARVKRGWKVEGRDAVGIVLLALVVILVRTLFAPAPVELLPLHELPQGYSQRYQRDSSEGYQQNFSHEPSREFSEESQRSTGEWVTNVEARRGEPFPFDPNTLDFEGFVQLGFSAAQAQALLRYRASGAVFRKPEDFARAYVVSKQMYQKLLPYIRIAPTSSPQAEKSSASIYEAAPSPITLSQVTPPEAADPPVTASLITSPQRELIEINSADTSRLQKIRGIGPYYAQKIVLYRHRLGGFVAMEQLMEIEGIDEARFEMMIPQIEIDYDLVRPLNLKSADQTTLGQHPYIGPYAARWIVHYRQQLGDTVCTLPSLLRRNIIKEQQVKWLEYYVE